MNKLTNMYQNYKTGTINKLTCLETYAPQPGGPLKGPADNYEVSNFSFDHLPRNHREIDPGISAVPLD